MDYPMDRAAQGGSKRFFDLIRKILPKALDARSVICGIPMGQGRIGIAKDVDRDKVMKEICLAMEKIAKTEKAWIIAFKDFIGTYDGLFANLMKDGFSQMETLPSTDMNVNFANFDDYLKSLSSVSRSGLKRKFKEIDGKVKIDLEVLDKLDAKALDEAYGLYLQTYHKQEMGFEKLTPDFFERIAENMPKESKFFLWRIDGKLVAFAFCLAKDDYMIDYYLGFDYEVAFKYHLYFVRFRDIMEWCIKNNIRKYEMGVTAYEAKRRMGFEYIPMYIYARSPSKVLNPALKLLCRIFKPDNYHSVFDDMKKD
jgi:predicted N-acyltransferase